MRKGHGLFQLFQSPKMLLR
uniref:Uncharacterized protein n=1 Tax=Arundo donax TaxID=35708 RepID=A0A0A9G0H4_ARUDO